MDNPAPGTLVKALYTFKGSNNDELCFRKGDTITISRTEEGGWWEGTLAGKSGWFPSNYVARTDDDKKAEIKRGSVMNYHQMVVQSMVESEKNYVTELQQVIQSYLHPIHTAGYLTPQQYKYLIGNLDDLVKFHMDYLLKLENVVAVQYLQQRVGTLFLNMAPQLKRLYEAYFSNHPWAVQVMLSKKDDLNLFMESKGIPPPGTMELTTCLSKPFNRMEQYATILKELERHIEDCHPDRGDTQRALAVCKEINASCIELRKQKEVECEIRSDLIDGITDEMCSSLGSLVYLGNVLLVEGERKHSVLALFQHQVILLLISSCMSGYQFQGKMSVSGLTVNSLDDTDTQKNAFEISAGKDKRVVACLNPADKKKWMELFSQVATTNNNNNNTRTASGVNQLKLNQMNPLSPKPVKSLVDVNSGHNMNPWTKQQPTQGSTASVCKPRTWSQSCLRPMPPLKPTFVHKEAGSQSPRSVRKQNSQRRKAAERTRSEDGYALRRIEEMKTMEEDALILQVIEAYCTSSRTRHTVNSLDLSKLRREEDVPPHVHRHHGHAQQNSPQHQARQSSIQKLPAPPPPSMAPPIHHHHANCPNRHRELIPHHETDYDRLQRSAMKGFCCASFPSTKGIVRALKRL